MDEIITVAVTLGLIVTSALIDKKRTMKGLMKSKNMFMKLLPQFLMLLVAVTLFLAFMPPSVIGRILGENSGAVGILSAATLGSIAIIPGPIIYPLASELQQNGVSYGMLAIFIVSSMMVGVLTFPVEKEYFGFRLAFLRNLLSVISAIIIGLVVGVIL